MTSLLLSTLPGLGCRSLAGGFSSRLGCHVLNRRGGNTAPWPPRQQMRFASGEKDDYDGDHYKTLGVKRSDSTATIRKKASVLLMATHSDHNEGIDNSKFIKINAAYQILGNQAKREKYDQILLGKQHEAQANAVAQQREADALRKAAVARDLARRREEARRAKEAAEAAEAKKRDEERKAKKKADKLAKREAQEAEAERQRKNAEEKQRKAAREDQRKAAGEDQRKAAEENQRRAAEENQRRAAKQAAKAERKEEEEEAARKKAEAAAASQAAAKARAAERERERARELRMVLLRHVPVRAQLWHVTRALEPFKPGRILDSGVGEGTAWVEFWKAEQAEAVQRIVTETDQCVILGKTIKTASIYQGRAKPPDGSEFVTRSLYILVPSGFLDGEAEVYPLLERKLHEKGFTTRPAGKAEGYTLTGKWLVEYYASVANAQSAKAAMEKHYPELKVIYTWDPCEGVVSTTPQPQPKEGAGASSESTKKGSDSLLSPFDLVVAFVMVVIGIYMDKDKAKDKSSDNETQQKKEDR